MECIGIKRINFTDKKTGEVIEGTRVFYTYPDDKVEGLACDSVFLSPQKYALYGILPGDAFDILYNKYGKVDRLVIA